MKIYYERFCVRFLQTGRSQFLVGGIPTSHINRGCLSKIFPVHKNVWMLLLNKITLLGLEEEDEEEEEKKKNPTVIQSMGVEEL